MRKFVNWKQAIPSLIIVLVLLVSMGAGAAYAKYVMDLEQKGNVTINASLGKIELWETPVTYEAETGYADGTSAQVSSASYTYDPVIPGLDIPKDTFVKITDKSVIEAYVYIKVDTNISSNDTGIKYTLNSCWQPLAGYTDVYVYCDNNKNPIAVTSDIDIPILEKDSEGKSYIIVSQYLKQNVSGGVYLNFYASMYEVAAGTDAASVYQHYNPQQTT